jgi:hypothetical protein
MSVNNARRLVLRRVIAAAVAAATPISFVRVVRAATRKSTGTIPKRTVLDLADGKKIEIVSQGGALVGRVLDARGGVISAAPAGKLTLKSGKTLTFDKSGRLTQGRIADQSFLLECDPPPAKCPP